MDHRDPNNKASQWQQFDPLRILYEYTFSIDRLLTFDPPIGHNPGLTYDGGGIQEGDQPIIVPATEGS